MLAAVWKGYVYSKQEEDRLVLCLSGLIRPIWQRQMIPIHRSMIVLWWIKILERKPCSSQLSIGLAPR
jgi:hypothetical protein